MSTVHDFFNPDWGENKIIGSAQNTPDIEEKHGNGNISDGAAFKGGKLKDKSVAMLLIFQEEISLKLKSPSCLRVWSLFLQPIK